MGRVMAIVSQARLTMAVIGVSFFRGSITIAKGCFFRLVDVQRNTRAFYYLPWLGKKERKKKKNAENHAYFFVEVPCLLWVNSKTNATASP